jgi:F0F1-type ATP synthase membrane subunit a
MFSSPLEQFDVKPLIFITLGNKEFTFFDIFVPLVLIIILFIYISFLKNYFKLIPFLAQTIFENIVEFMFSIIKNQVGTQGYIYLPFIFTLFIFVLISNLLSIVPFGVSLTSHLIILL